MKKIYIFLFIGAFAIVNAQTNLVPNPGFEIASPCPDYPGQTNRATGWNNVNLVYNNPSVGTPDFFHACGSATLGYNCVPPNTFSGICSPRTGNGFMSVVVYNVPYPDYREYFATQLTSPMTIGNTYTVSFWVTNGSTPYSPYIIKNIGVNFSTSPLSQTGWGLIALTPQCEVTTLVGGTTWQQYTFTVTATAAWQHIAIGSFRSAVTNPSELLISQTDEAYSGSAIGAVIEGQRPLLVETQALVSTAIYGTPQRSTTGFDLRRLSMMLAVLEKRCGFYFGQKDVFLNMAGGLRIEDPAIDLAVCAALISSLEDIPLPAKMSFAAEIGLTGEVRAVSRIEQRIAEAERLGFEAMIISRFNMRQMKNKSFKITIY